MLDELRKELIAMRAGDLRVRQELVDAGELGGSYVPRMEALHIKNARRLEEIIARHGWPDEPKVGADGAEAACLLFSTPSDRLNCNGSAFGYSNAQPREAAFPNGRLPISKIESPCTKVARSVTERSGWTTPWMVESVLGTSWMPTG